jgi:DNA modification methylase
VNSHKLTDTIRLFAKLKHDIQNDSELGLAKAELSGLGCLNIEQVINCADLLLKKDFQQFVQMESPRLQDFLTRLPYPGAIQGYSCQIKLELVRSLLERLSYFKELYFTFEAEEGELPKELLGQHEFSSSSSDIKLDYSARTRLQVVSPYLQIFTRLVEEGCKETLVRAIPLHVLLEPSHYVCQLAYNTKQADRMFDLAIRHFTNSIYYPFSPSSARWFKTVEDFIDARDAPQLYLTHYIGAKGKFFPRMARAILNEIKKKKKEEEEDDDDDSIVLDPFCGSGTMNLEAALEGYDTIGLDIQPLFCRITKLKIEALLWDHEDLKNSIEKLMERLATNKGELGKFIDRPMAEVFLPNSLAKKVNKESFDTVKSIIGAINEMKNREYGEFCTLAIAYWARSMLKKQTPEKILETFSTRLWSMYFAVRYFARFQEIYKIRLGRVKVYACDVKNLAKELPKVLGDWSSKKKEVKTIITSPPYGNAVDYIGEHVYALYLLGLTNDHLKLDKIQIGSPRVGSVTIDSTDSQSIPEVARKSIMSMVQHGKKTKAASMWKYLIDMERAFQNMSEVLSYEGDLVMVIGKEQTFELDGEETVFPLGQIMEEIGQSFGLKVARTVDIGLRKASERGGIPTEHIIYFRK